MNIYRMLVTILKGLIKNDIFSDGNGYSDSTSISIENHEKTSK